MTSYFCSRLSPSSCPAGASYDASGSALQGLPFASVDPLRFLYRAPELLGDSRAL
jgi:hypothetical protein